MSDFYTPPPFKSCQKCDGYGGVETIVDDYEIGMGHSHDCDGTCKNCPVPIQVPVRKQEIEPCPTCNGIGSIPIWYTIPQWEKLTGRKVPDDMPVIYRNYSKDPWECDFLCNVPGIPTAETVILIATESGHPSATEARS